jgi:hypothetical protein
VGLKDDLVRGVKMASIASLDSEIEKTRSQVEEMRTKIDKSSKVLVMLILISKMPVSTMF